MVNLSAQFIQKNLTFHLFKLIATIYSHENNERTCVKDVLIYWRGVKSNFLSILLRKQAVGISTTHSRVLLPEGGLKKCYKCQDI